jgi:hypothetical protein
MEYHTKKTYRPMKNEAYPSFDVLYKKVRSILEAARANVYRVANTEMVQAYWNIGKGFSFVGRQYRISARWTFT